MDLDGIFEQAALAGTQWSVDLRGEGPGSGYRRNGDARLRTASVAKVFVLLELADRIASGDTDPAALLDRRTVAPVGDSGLWQHLATDQLPVVDVAMLVGSVSDNLATNVLVRRLGLEAIQARATHLAPGGSNLHDLVRDARTTETPPTLSEGCASDWASILQELNRGAVEGEAASTQVLDWLSSGTDLSMVAAAFDLDPLAHASGTDRGARLWNKTGTDAGVRADVGVVECGDTTWTYAVICNWDAYDDGPRSAVLATMREIGSAIRRAATDGRTSRPG